MISIENLLLDEVVSEQKEDEEEYNFIEKMPWVEKYRPQKIDDIMYQHEVKEMLKDTLKSNNLPHLLFYGPPGTGKTSTILAIAKELFGPNIYRERVVELNASDERGINIVRNKIGRLAKTAIGSPDPDYPSPPYRIIILDEADAMTTEAQSALRKTMEDYSSITRFCFICNYINQIIEPIASRCVKFRFKQLDEESMYIKLKNISENENINIDDICIRKLIEISEGDMRKSITFLQNLAYVLVLKDSITCEDIYEMSNYIPDRYIEAIDKYCIQSKNEDIYNAVSLAKKIRRNGYPVNNLIKRLQNHIVDHDDVLEKHKALICLKLSNIERKLNMGSDEYIQILNILMYIKGVVLERITQHSPICLL